MGRERQGHGGAEVPDMQNPPQSDKYLGAGQCQQKGKRTSTGNSGRRRHAAQGVETSGGGWKVAGVGDVQVGGN